MRYVQRQPSKLPTESHTQNMIWFKALLAFNNGEQSGMKGIRRADAAVEKYLRETGKEKTDPLETLRAIQQYK